jgi:serine-type D-Ala-D-Ala carboxypeptidase (penicillin-binding protein 5/6)
MTTQQDDADATTELVQWMHDGADAREVPVDRVARRRRRRIVLLVFALIVLLAAGGTGGYATWALTAPLPAPTMQTAAPRVGSPPAAVAIPLPGEGASALSVAGGEVYLGPDAAGTWLTSGTDDARPIASISKLITALVVLDARPLAGPDDPGPTLTFDKAAHDLYDKYYVQGATVAAMPIGSRLSERDALAALLIPSASNYAEAVSTWAFGSQTAFVAAARSWLAAHGLAHTRLVEPTGIDRRNTSTPSDLLALGRIAAAHPVVSALTATRTAVLGDIGAVSNTNALLGVDGITGLKTGNLGEGTHNLLYTATLDVGAEAPLLVTGVVMGGSTRESVQASVRALLDGIRRGFHAVPVVEAGREVGTLTTPWGSSARLVVAQAGSVFTWSDTPVTVAMDVRTPTQYRDGEQVGEVTWSAGAHSGASDVRVAGTIQPPTAWWRLTHPELLGAG